MVCLMGGDTGGGGGGLLSILYLSYCVNKNNYDALKDQPLTCSFGRHHRIERVRQQFSYIYQCHKKYTTEK